MLKRIYTLRARCQECNLDKMEVFYTVPNSTPKGMASQLKPHINKAFETRYNCTHKVKYNLIRDEEYKWDTKQNKEVKI